MNRTIIREHVETDLGDDAIERLIRDAFNAISTRHAVGYVETVASGAVQASFDWNETAFAIIEATGELLMLPQTSRLLSTDITISEWVTDDEDFSALDADDWQQWSARQIRRNFNGTNVPTGNGWASPVKVEYGVNAIAADRIVIDLVRLAIQHNALSSERAGDYSSSSVEYQRERERILNELVPAMGVA